MGSGFCFCRKDGLVVVGGGSVVVLRVVDDGGQAFSEAPKSGVRFANRGFVERLF